MTDPGELDQKIGFYSLTAGASDGMGGFPVSETLICSVWAKVTPLRGQESDDYGRRNSTENYKFRVYNSIEARSVTTKDFIRWNGSDFNITSIPTSGPITQFVDFMATSGLPQ